MKRYVTPSRAAGRRAGSGSRPARTRRAPRSARRRRPPRGSPANARAIATRCLRPPESCVGRSGEVALRHPHRPDQLEQPRLQRLRRRGPASRCSARPTSRRTLWRRLSAESGFWKTIWSAFTCSRVRLRASPATATPRELDLRPRIGRGQAEQDAGEGGLAAARLADEAERLAGADVEVDVDQPRGRARRRYAERLRHAAQAARPAPPPRATAGDLQVDRRLARQLGRALVVVAARRAAGADVVRRRRLGAAAVVGERAAVGEDAARGSWRPAAGRKPGDRVEAAVVLAPAAARDAAQEADRVRMARLLEHLASPCPPRPARRRRARRRGRTCLAITPRLWLMKSTDVENSSRRRGDEVEHLGLDRGVERRWSARRGSAARVRGERHRDHDALLHPARELVRVAAA